ncbi:hypothetical protein Tco_0329117 [Tanacetum coccineum]
MRQIGSETMDGNILGWMAGGLHTAEEMAEDGFGTYWLGSERVLPDKGDLSDYWVKISSDGTFRVVAPLLYLHQRSCSEAVPQVDLIQHFWEEPILKKYIENAQAESDPTKPIIVDNINFELNKEFLIELKNNAYHGMFDEDVVDHIAKVLEILDLIKIPGVDSYWLRMKVFPLSLADDARQWWINKGEGKITTWKELVEKFFCKFYPESYDGEDEMLDEGDNWGIDPLEFIS